MFTQEEFEKNPSHLIEGYLAKFEPTHYNFDSSLAENEDGLVEAQVFFDKVRFRADGKTTKWFDIRNAEVKTANNQIKLVQWDTCDEFWPESKDFKIKQTMEKFESSNRSFKDLEEALDLME